MDRRGRRSKEIQRRECGEAAAARDRRRGSLVRLRKHFPAQSFHGAHRIEGRWAYCDASGRGGHRPRQRHRDTADLRRCVGGADRSLRLYFRRHFPLARLRKNFSVAPNLCEWKSRQYGRSGAAPRHTEIGRRMRVRAVHSGRGFPNHGGRRKVALHFVARPAAGRERLRSNSRSDFRSAHEKSSTKTDKESRTRSMVLERRWPK